MSQILCVRCGGALAMADNHCAACGEPVGPAQRAGVLGERASAMAEAGNYDQAARLAGTLLGLPLEAQDAKLWLRKRSSWLQRSGRPEALDEAEADLRRSLNLDDADDLGHQLWVDLLHRRGRLDLARAEYGRRLEQNPDDAVAKRHFASLKLMDDLRVAPKPTLNLPQIKEGFLVRLLKPNPSKMVAAGFAALSCLWAFFETVGGKHGISADLVAGMQSMGPVVQLLMDPWLNLLQFVLYSAYVFWGWRERRAS